MTCRRRRRLHGLFGPRAPLLALDWRQEVELLHDLAPARPRHTVAASVQERTNEAKTFKKLATWTISESRCGGPKLPVIGAFDWRVGAHQAVSSRDVGKFSLRLEKNLPRPQSSSMLLVWNLEPSEHGAKGWELHFASTGRVDVVVIRLERGQRQRGAECV